MAIVYQSMVTEGARASVVELVIASSPICDRPSHLTEEQLVPTPEEVAQQEAQRAERLAAKLRELNIDPDSI